MENLILVAHLLIALAIIGVILLQRGKGAEVGASFGGGASQTLFGSAGSWNFFSRLTAILATLFFCTSLALAVIARNSAGIGSEDIPAIEIQRDEIMPAEDTEIPSLTTETDTIGGDSGEDIPTEYDIPSVELPELQTETMDMNTDNTSSGSSQ
ncbi:MAG TPA: preprotein translocase subunit SecG [Porticoccaceae bacterium]|nr:preprotein translocase subunit SecG [Porticoccaceae bacterium]